MLLYCYIALLLLVLLSATATSASAPAAATAATTTAAADDDYYHDHEGYLGFLHRGRLRTCLVKRRISYCCPRP